jgi:hypothetical protein
MGSKASSRLVLSLTVLCAALSLTQRDQVLHTLSFVSPSFSAGVPQFAIGDFDGDRKPDLAEVHVEPSDSQSTRYSITVHLASGVSQSIGMTAPFGGLEIVPRDVNGDNAPDLVVSTTLRHEPVAVLLNDGHGNFTRVEPNSFPAAFNESKTKLGSASNQVIDAVGVPPQSRTGFSLSAEALLDFRPLADSIRVSIPGFLGTSFLTSHSGRAPPSNVLHS